MLNASLVQREVAWRSHAGGIDRTRLPNFARRFSPPSGDNPSVSLTADSSLYTREPLSLVQPSSDHQLTWSKIPVRYAMATP